MSNMDGSRPATPTAPEENSVDEVLRGYEEEEEEKGDPSELLLTMVSSNRDGNI
ncbi:hypothetical protein IscW_ISCW014539 [Ixodes scapularis]|uniref:Uncharacterized protein n=1 Tax=Ixodes scapularis TaxID=6945 RepID=B7QK91_IXOSC|nr:hypothetical protein IscW_ISCW014539 [Ixodes scapularis]|eukprot:XP_002415598.1 hypothetical protein IscW_ISCW014539 [Ixodes scapularis]